MSIKASVLLLTYNQEKFIQDALHSILNQDYPNLEIVINDDNSNDQTWEIIKEITSNHPKKNQIILNKNQKNLGVVGNYNKAFSLSSGEVIFTAAGDDISLPNRCSACIEFWWANSKPDLIAADGYDMSTYGLNLGIKKTDDLEKWDLKKWAQKRPYFFGASHMMSRKLISINTLDPNLPHEDQCFVLRGIMLGSIKRLGLPLVFHRRGGVSQPQITESIQLKKDALVKACHDGYTEFTQIIQDSKYLNIDNKFISLIESKYNNYSYGYKILTSKTKFQALKIFLTFKGVSIFKRLRYLNYALIPSIMQYIYMHKKKYGKK